MHTIFNNSVYHHYIHSCIFSSITRSAVQQNLTSQTANNLLSIVDVRIPLHVCTHVNVDFRAHPIQSIICWLIPMLNHLRNHKM